MTPVLTLEQFADAVAISEDDQWTNHLVEAALTLVPQTTAATLFLLREQELLPVATRGTPPTLKESDLRDLPRREEQALLLPIPTVPDALLWLETPQHLEEAQHRLVGWLAVAGLGLSRQEQARDVEQQRAARDHFFSMVNHDLKSPLSSVKAMADLLLRKMQRGTLDPSTEEGQADLVERLTFLSRRAKDLAHLIDEIGDVSTIERGRLALNFQPVELGSALQSSIERLEVEKPERSAMVESEAQPLVGQVDAHRIIQLFYILLKNAMDYSDSNTPVTVRLREEAGSAHIEIKDEGRGIPDELQARLFKVYGHSVQQTPSGLGVGLYVASALARAHGGSLTLESTPEKGTTVYLRLPLQQGGSNLARA